MSMDGSKLSMLDRFLVSSNFFSWWPNPYVEILPKLYFDHSPLFFKALAADFGASYFKFYNYWLSDPQLLEILSNSWASDLHMRHRSPILSFMAKLRKVKDGVKNWRSSTRISSQ